MPPFPSWAAGLSLLLHGVAFGQAELTTYYIVPPTADCNGTWAFGPYAALWGEGCTGPYTYLFDPATCIAGHELGQPVPLNVVGDTILMGLCAQPCDFLFYSAEGLCAYCTTGPAIPTALPEHTGTALRLIGPIPVPANARTLTVELDGSRAHQLRLLDRAGRTVWSAGMMPGRRTLDLGGVASGDYLLLDQSERGLTVQRLVLE